MRVLVLRGAGRRLVGAEAGVARAARRCRLAGVRAAWAARASSAARSTDTLTMETTLLVASSTATGPLRSGLIERPSCSGYMRRLHGRVVAPIAGRMSTV